MKQQWIELRERIDIGSRYIFLTRHSSIAGKDWYIVWNTHAETELARLVYYAQWRAYVLRPEPNTEWDATCLTAISNFMIQLKKA